LWIPSSAPTDRWAGDGPELAVAVAGATGEEADGIAISSAASAVADAAAAQRHLLDRIAQAARS
jgi:hypothetical protein